VTDYANQTALVTGANSGLGFEAASQLAELGYGTVIISARTQEKAESAGRDLVARTGADVFETIVLDNDVPATVETAAATLVESGREIDFLLLNAGIAPRREITRTADGIEATVAASLVGHHLLTMRLLDGELLTTRARIVIAGSEAARGDVPTFNPTDMGAFATEHTGGDLEAAIEAQFRMQPPATYKPGDTYATVKMFVAWWAAELADMLPEGMTVNAVSPGSTPGTNAIQNAPFYMRKIMVPLFKILPGMSHSVADGAGRYLEAAAFGDQVSGKFFASRPRKMTGPLTEIQMGQFDDADARRAMWKVTTAVAGAGYPARA